MNRGSYNLDYYGSRTYRLFLLLLAFLYPVWFLIYRELIPNAVDSIEERLVVSLVSLTFFFLSFDVKWVKNNLGILLTLIASGTTVHFFSLWERNEFHPFYRMGLFICMSSILVALSKLSYMAIYVGITGLCLLRYFLQGVVDQAALLLITFGMISVAFVSLTSVLIRNRILASYHASQKKLRVLAESLKTSVVLLDHSGFVVEANRDFLDFAELGDDKLLLHRPFVECLIRCQKAGKIIHPSQQAFDVFLADVSNLREVKKTEIVFKDFRSNTQKWIEFSLSRISEEKAQSGDVGFIITLVDVSEARAAERELEMTRAKFIHSSRLASLGEMAGGVAHEINNPLAIISGKVTLMQKKIAERKLESEYFQKSLATMAETIKRIESIIKGLRYISRGSTDQMGFTATTTGEILDNVLSLCSEKFRNAGLELVVDNPFADESFDCAGIQIAQVLLNLLNNAFDAVEESAFKQVKIEVRANEALLTFAVSDTGPGVPPSIERQIFEPFFTTKDIGRGTGLGLSISQGIVRWHGGNLKLSRKENRTTFTVELPRNQASKRQVAA